MTDTVAELVCHNMPLVLRVVHVSVPLSMQSFVQRVYVSLSDKCNLRKSTGPTGGEAEQAGQDCESFL